MNGMQTHNAESRQLRAGGLWFKVVLVNLELKGMENTPYEPGRDFNVMVAFDDDVTARRADNFLGMLAQHLKEDGGRLLHQWWNIDVLAFTSMGELAALEAAAADMIVLAIHDVDELPCEVAVWMKRFVDRRKGRPGALLAMLESDPGKLEVSQGVFSQLEQAAALGQMDFFATRVRAGRNGERHDCRAEGSVGEGEEGMTRVAIETAAQFVKLCKSRLRHKLPRGGKVPAETYAASRL